MLEQTVACVTQCISIIGAHNNIYTQRRMSWFRTVLDTFWSRGKEHVLVSSGVLAESVVGVPPNVAR